MKRRILIADDEPHIARILRMALERAGYGVDTVSNGQTALESVRATAPDVLITDIEMPRMDGRELVETISGEFPDRQYPIFIMTSRTNLEYRGWSKNFNNAHFLEKPVSARQLIAELKNYFEAVAEK